MLTNETDSPRALRSTMGRRVGYAQQRFTNEQLGCTEDPADRISAPKLPERLEAGYSVRVNGGRGFVPVQPCAPLPQPRLALLFAARQFQAENKPRRADREKNLSPASA